MQNVFQLMYFILQIEEQTKLLRNLDGSMGSMDSLASDGSASSGPAIKRTKPSALERFKGGAKKAMLTWAQKTVTQ